ncbi:[citrate (pro-3S)-lyase] ligase [Actinobacillus equuli subsp. haemolyticus]|uniref:[citrate (pro-3S)-lyase] ligase n=1 Tax=Actinobacillus equuli TaxID=718 RepID=UPI0024417B48|nr:[citrate (pro-3S)-lyase] ligase [Actinobacillus equuli]WGE62333.1 [citrate (pro-3S)-lyase] ligase [Actinobacillus equuli subsp. haemolyticus]
MSEYSIGKVFASDKTTYQAIDQLLEQEGIRRDNNLDYTCAMYNNDDEVIATGSCFSNTLRCLAVSHQYQGEGLMNQIVTHLINEQFERGNSHIFLYTKTSTSQFFANLGFYEIARIEGKISFMENQRTGFANYLANLTACSPVPLATQRVAAIVMNANPFTLGHLYLVEKAASENDLVHLFIVSEDKSLVPFAVRKQLVEQGVAHLNNVICHESGSYIISSATFPSYFQENDNAVIESNAMLDLQIFTRIATALGIQRRYVGDEPFSRVTNIYNQIMQDKLPEQGIECVIVPRKDVDEQIISASAVRELIKNGDFTTMKQMVPASTYQFFTSEAAKPVIACIQATDNVRHY